MEIADPAFREAVDAIDTGDLNALERVIMNNPRLLHERLREGKEGYFKDPYLLWFVSGNPVRHEKLAYNIVDITRWIIAAAKKNQVALLQHQMNYTLGLVSSGRVPRECNVQRGLIDVLVENGADPNKGMDPAIVHRELDAIKHLLKHGARLSLIAAIALQKNEDIKRILPQANQQERQIALAVAAFYGQPRTLAQLIAAGVDINAYNPDSFHSHSMPLHQAIISGSLDSVKLLVEAGASLKARDKLYNGIPLGWALYGRPDAKIADYLRERMALETAGRLLEAGLIKKEDLEKVVQTIAKDIDA